MLSAKRLGVKSLVVRIEPTTDDHTLAVAAKVGGGFQFDRKFGSWRFKPGVTWECEALPDPLTFRYEAMFAESRMISYRSANSRCNWRSGRRVRRRDPSGDHPAPPDWTAFAIAASFEGDPLARGLAERCSNMWIAFALFAGDGARVRSISGQMGRIRPRSPLKLSRRTGLRALRDVGCRSPGRGVERDVCGCPAQPSTALRSLIWTRSARTSGGVHSPICGGAEKVRVVHAYPPSHTI